MHWGLSVCLGEECEGNALGSVCLCVCPGEQCEGNADLCTLRILPYSSVFVTEFNPEYRNTDLLIWLRKRSSPKYGNGHHLNIFFTVISCVKNVAPSVGNVHVPLYYARCQATRNIP